MRRFNQAAEQAHQDTWTLEDQLAAVYASVFRKAADLAVERFRQISVAQPVLAAGNPGWVPPNPEELVTPEELSNIGRTRLERLWRKAVKLGLLPFVEKFDLGFDLINPFAELLYAQIASRQSMVWEAYRDEVTKTLEESYQEGLSVPDTARDLKQNIDGLKNSTAKMVARTDLNAIGNGSSLAAATALGDAAPQFKRWLSAGDERVRETHVEANGQVVPVGQPFQVGAEAMQFPGDPTASDQEICNCRCTLIYTDELGMVAAGWDEQKHPRHARGEKGGGRFRLIGADGSALPGPVTARKIELTSEEAQRIADQKGLPNVNQLNGHQQLAARNAAKRRLSEEINAEVAAQKQESSAGRFQSVADVEDANPGVMFNVTEDTDAIQLHGIFSVEPGQGAGSKALDDLGEYADSKGIPIYLTPEQADDQPGSLSTAQLKAWYKRHGYVKSPSKMEDYAFTHSMVRRPKGMTAAAVDYTGGSMVALYPHPDQAAMLEQPDGQPAEDLHITLCYLPNGWDGDKGAAMTGLVEVASVWGKLEGTVTGVSLFQPGEDGVPWIAVPSVRTLEGLREVVRSVLEDAEVTVADDYEFTPHITLGYDVEPTRDVAGVPLTFTAISAVDGPERVNVPLEPELVAAAWDESKHPRDPEGEGGGRWVRASDLASDDFKPEEQTTDRDTLMDQYGVVQGLWDTESRGALEQYVQHEMTDEEYQSYSIQDEKAANKGIVQDRIAAALEGDPDFLSLHKAIFESSNNTFEDWKSEFEPGGEYATANTPEKQVSAMMVSAWARSSSDTDPISLQLQEAAVEEFGLEGHTSFHVEQLDEMKGLYAGSTHSPIWNDQQKAGARKFLRAQYDLTQQMFQRHGISDVTLYRGMAWTTSPGPEIGLGSGGQMTRMKTNPMSSFSYSFDTAVGFASKYDVQAVLGTKVNVKRILSTPFTGAGCLSEGEMVVIGGDDTDGFVVSWALKRMNPATGEVEPPVGEIVNSADLFDDRWMDAIDGGNRSRA